MRLQLPEILNCYGFEVMRKNKFSCKPSLIFYIQFNRFLHSGLLRNKFYIFLIFFFQCNCMTAYICSPYFCVFSDSALEDLIQEVVKASNRGVSAANNVSGEPNWSFGQSLFFSSTIVTTIGMFI